VLQRPDPGGVREGDLVALNEDGVTLAGKNGSPRELDEQEWWRLMRVAPNLRARARILAAIRAWFADEGFVEVDTPALTAGPALDVQLTALETSAGYLITSPEFHMKRLLSAGMDRIYYLGKAFRDDERGALHHREFTMLEWYRAGAEPDEIMTDVKALVAVATGTERQWTTLTVAQALARWGTPTDDPDSVVRQLVEVVEPALASLGAVFLTEYPAALAALARLKPNNPAVSERFEAYVDGVELANGFGELTDSSIQRTRFEQDQRDRRTAGKPVYPIDEHFLDALAAGIPRTTGIALGVDRLVMVALGTESIDDVVSFPPEIA